MRIFTGGPVPDSADVVIRREDVIETPDTITLRAPLDKIRPGNNIRRCGENAPAGACVARAGSLISSPLAAALASFGYATVHVRRRVRVAIIITGDEVVDIRQSPTRWQSRDANGPALVALLGRIPWLQTLSPRYVADDRRL